MRALPSTVDRILEQSGRGAVWRSVSSQCLLLSSECAGTKLTSWSWRRLRVFRAATAQKSMQPPPGD